MSPVSRSRGKKNRNTRRSTGPRVVRAVPEECDCPACTGDIDPVWVLGEMLDAVRPLLESGDALAAEVAAATFVAMATAVGDDLMSVLIEGFIPEIETEPSGVGLALLLAMGSVASAVWQELAEAASAAAGRFVAAGIAEPTWAGELAAPARVGDCLRLYDGGAGSVVVAPFERSGVGHAFMVMVDEEKCGAAEDILVLDADHLPEALDAVRESGDVPGQDVQTQVLDPAEARWYIEQALDARAVHDEQWASEPVFEPIDEARDVPPYPVLAMLLQARLAMLPPARRPDGAHQHVHTNDLVTVLESMESIMAGAGSGRGGGFGVRGFGRPVATKLPTKRKQSDGPAPIYQVKVALRGTKPPIWRRLLVPADLNLARLHDVIQAAFGWQDYHLHVFETPYGDFGQPDRDLGYRAEGPVTLEQVAPQVKDKIRYTYDFGDDWVHEIVVEKVLDRDPALAYPRCAGGRRAAPPEDCGGVWGYQTLLEILADPRDPEHEERLEWLGLADASQFDPAAFDVEAVNQVLARLRR